MSNAGSKYQADRKGTDIAKLIRADVKAACKADGPLKGCKVSVRYHLATHTTSIDVDLVSGPFSFANAAYHRALAADPYSQPAGICYSAAAVAAIDALKEISDEYHAPDAFFLRAGVDWQTFDAHIAAVLAEHPACCGCSDCEDALAA